MRILQGLAVFSLLFCFVCCTNHLIPLNVPKDSTGVPVDVSVSIIGLGGMGHGCPVGNGIIYTARHVVVDRTTGKAIREVVWSDHLGNNGRAVLLKIDTARDLAALKISSGKTHELEIATAITPGERIHWWDYDWSSKEAAFDAKLRWARVLGPNVAQHIRMSETPAKGASGGCLVNDSNEVVGIVVFGLQLRNLDVLGGAVSLIEDPRVH